MTRCHRGASEAVPHRHRSCRSGGWRPNWEGTAQQQGAAGEIPTPTLAARLQTLADKLVRKMEIRTVMQQPSA
jgi:hypothetical protein